MTGATGPSPTDLATGGNGRYLYVRNSDGSISAFIVMADGQLNAITSGAGGLPMTTVGLAGF